MTAAMPASSNFHPPIPNRRASPPGLFATLLALWRNPLEIWTERHFEMPVLIGRSAIGTRAVVSAPEGVKRILLDNVANYRKDALQLRILGPGLGTGLLTSEGPAWRAQRRAIAPSFSPRQVADFAAPMHQVCRLAAERLAGQVGEEVDVAVETAKLTLEVLEQTLFSQGLGRDAGQFQHAVSRYFDTFGRVDPLDLLGAPDFLPRLGRLRGRSALAFFDEAVDDIIAARKRSLAGGETAPNDLLTLLLRAHDPETGAGMSEMDVRANIVTFIGAGHETTANTLTWAMYLLSQAPDWRAQTEAEVDAVFDPASDGFDLTSFPVLRAVIEEAMRLYPPAAILTREAIGEDWLAGVKIPAGTIVAVSPFVLHRHRTLWRDPDGFDPGRFLGARREEIDRFAYIPFGAGPRVCIGMGFALQEAVIAMAHLLARLQFDLKPGHEVQPRQRVTLRPKDGMPMRISARKS